jgi:hypothetical protein
MFLAEFSSMGLGPSQARCRRVQNHRPATCADKALCACFICMVIVQAHSQLLSLASPFLREIFDSTGEISIQVHHPPSIYTQMLLRPDVLDVCARGTGTPWHQCSTMTLYIRHGT